MTTSYKLEKKIDPSPNPYSGDLYRTALAKTLGQTHAVKLQADCRGFQCAIQGESLFEVAAFPGLRTAYTLLTGDTRLARFGKRLRADVSTDTFEAAFGDALNQRLVQDYKIGYRLMDIATAAAVPNFKSMEIVRLGFIGDLADVGEGDPFLEINPPADEKAFYLVTKRGGLITVTREAVLADEVGAIQRVIQQVARSASRTLARYVWQKFITNATYTPDSKAIFHVDHANLGSAALSVAALNAARSALFNMKELDAATDRLGLSGPFLLVVPVELESVALGIANSEIVDGAANPWFRRFGANNENIFANPLLTDADDWFLFDISGNVGIVEIGFLLGLQQPQILLSDTPIADAAFRQEQIIYRVRHEWGAEVVDFRGCYKSAVSS